MLHLFRKNGMGDGSPMDPIDGSVLVSHILVKFLKRLRHMDKPHLLDLGRLSGSNIEFFVRRGCKVQVEDFLFAFWSGPGQETPQDERPAGIAPRAKGADDRPLNGGILQASDTGTPAATLVPRTNPPGARAAVAISHTEAHRPGARPSRRIVLPPRTFAASKPPIRRPEAEVRNGRMPGPQTTNALLPTAFAYPDETFDAIVAWDIFNYYGSGALTLLAAEARRVLKPGGLLLGYFQARRPDGPEAPGRFRILDEGRVACDRQSAPALQRHVYQNRDIEKMFTGLSIVELYFLKNATRELLMEKKNARAPQGRSVVRPATPKPRFTLE